MIQWLLRLLGMEPATPAARRKSLVARLQTPNGDESPVMQQAQATLERHAVREQAIATHKAETEEHTLKCKQERQECQSDIVESTQALEQAHRRHTTKRRRKNPPNPFDLAELAKKEARRQREA